jgi:hypothetical protein
MSSNESFKKRTVRSHLVKHLVRFKIVSAETFYRKHITYTFLKLFKFWNEPIVDFKENVGLFYLDDIKPSLLEEMENRWVRLEEHIWIRQVTK